MARLQGKNIVQFSETVLLGKYHLAFNTTIVLSYLWYHRSYCHRIVEPEILDCSAGHWGRWAELLVIPTEGNAGEAARRETRGERGVKDV